MAEGAGRRWRVRRSKELRRRRLCLTLGSQLRERIQPVIEAEEEKLEIKEKTLPAGQLAADRYGLVPLPGQVEKVEKVVAATQPKISFRKRKNQSFRERDDDD